jgi:P-type Mg2+ transporter
MIGKKTIQEESNKATNLFTEKLVKIAFLSTDEALISLESRHEGLTNEEIDRRVQQFGLNIAAREKKASLLSHLWDNVRNPLVLLLLVLGAISYFTGDLRSAIVIGVMVLLGVVLRFFQEVKADNAAQALKALVSTTATVIRTGEEKEIPLHELVPGDIVKFSAGDMVPADLRVLTAKDLFVNQAALTGEAVPVEKSHSPARKGDDNPLEMNDLIFQGSNIETGSGTAVVINTGSQTYFGSLSASLLEPRELTDFDKGINQFTWLMIGLMAVLVPMVFVLNGLSKHNWLEAFMFALAVAVGLTPEMLPMIVTVNLSKGAIVMSKKKVIVRHLNAIQNFGAMDILCTDKTGTITQGKIILEKHLDITGKTNEKPLEYGYLNSHFQTGLKNLLDVAILKHKKLEDELINPQKFVKLDEIPFDFERRRMSVVVEDIIHKQHILICKGAVEEINSLCESVEIDEKVIPCNEEIGANLLKVAQELNLEGLKVIAIAYKRFPDTHSTDYHISDESEMTLLGFLAFLDPPKESATQALKNMHTDNVQVKILTGDNDLVTINICQQVGLSVDKVLLGNAVETMTDDELALHAEEATIFAKLSPHHKQRIIRALQQKGHVVGFMGDGINDAPALKAADVGISVNSAVDIAKESSDIILLENSLLVLHEGVLEGRRVFGNIIKYIKMAASSNFGNMFSMLGASIFLPFLPMLPIQILTNNLLYDFSQTSIPTDEVDREWTISPRKWRIKTLRKFILFVGPISSIFDYATFFIMLYLFNCWNNPTLFHTAWFVESIFTQTMIIHVIRTNKIPFIQSRASWPLIATTSLVVLFAAWLPYSPLAKILGLVPLPPLYWLVLAGLMLGYVVLTQLVKTWFVHRFSE